MKLTIKQRKAYLQKRINALQWLVKDDIYKHDPWLKGELKVAKHCLKDKHYL